MGADRFVYWNEQKPTWEEIRMVTEDYLGDMLETIETDENKSEPRALFVTLTGRWSHPLRRMAEATDAVKQFASEPREPGWEGRYLEVWQHVDGVNVETRMQDEITCRIADGLAGVFARFWEGRLDRP